MPLPTSTTDPRTLLSLALRAVGTFLALYALTHRRAEVLGAAVVSGGLVAWTLTNAPYEGAVLLVPFDGNGVTAGDLLCLPGVVMLAILCWRGTRR